MTFNGVVSFISTLLDIFLQIERTKKRLERVFFLVDSKLSEIDTIL